ncbi:hypothetical protein EVAR_4738_1 [Eumeta japonica]|uniref:Uncharacterized protein n=1 Tax=Eumeta variegata TaxID=151549 RepID=A0A4C1T1L4_EUMVA|nr:hypothetical protein EVAR_4738_1 [Eumeta japonica]
MEIVLRLKRLTSEDGRCDRRVNLLSSEMQSSPHDRSFNKMCNSRHPAALTAHFRVEPGQVREHAPVRFRIGRVEMALTCAALISCES